MVQVLTGDNQVLLEHELLKLVSGFSGQVERVDGSEIDFETLSDLVHGLSLFSEQRLIVIRHLSANKLVWPVLSDWLKDIKSSTSRFILIEPNLDRRTKTYKTLARLAEIKTFQKLSSGYNSNVLDFVFDRAKEAGLKLSQPEARLIAERTGPSDFRVAQAIENLAVFDEINQGLIERVVDRAPEDNVFSIFSTTLRGQPKQVQALLADLRLQHDPYATFGLLSYQAEVLVGLILAGNQTSGQVAQELGVNSYSASQLAGHARQLNPKDGQRIIKQFRQTDVQIKSSSTDPWTMIEKLLVSLATSFS